MGAPMLASELIQVLTVMVLEHGDQDVCYVAEENEQQYQYYIRIESVVLGKPRYLGDTSTFVVE